MTNFIRTSITMVNWANENEKIIIMIEKIADFSNERIEELEEKIDKVLNKTSNKTNKSYNLLKKIKVKVNKISQINKKIADFDNEKIEQLLKNTNQNSTDILTTIVKKRLTLKKHENNEKERSLSESIEKWDSKENWWKTLETIKKEILSNPSLSKTTKEQLIHKIEKKQEKKKEEEQNKEVILPKFNAAPIYYSNGQTVEEVDNDIANVSTENSKIWDLLETLDLWENWEFFE